MPFILPFELSIHNGPGIGHKVKILKILPWPEQVQFSSVAHLCLILWPHELQHARLPCPSPTPWACSNSCSLSQWWAHSLSSPLQEFGDLILCSSFFPQLTLFPHCPQDGNSSLWTPKKSIPWSPILSTATQNYPLAVLEARSLTWSQ